MLETDNECIGCEQGDQAEEACLTEPSFPAFCWHVCTLRDCCEWCVRHCDCCGASTANLAVQGFGHNGAPSLYSVAEHGNQYTPRCFSNFAAFGSVTHVLRNFPLEPGNIA